jgi:hypothetical protein
MTPKLVGAYGVLRPAGLTIGAYTANVYRCSYLLIPTATDCSTVTLFLSLFLSAALYVLCRCLSV